MRRPRTRRTGKVRKPRSRSAARPSPNGLRVLPDAKSDPADPEVTEDLAEFRIVGIGASARGIEALRALLGEIPVDVGHARRAAIEHSGTRNGQSRASVG
jgi:chemotaxis response regulator CheB